ncbi:MAG: hypothetical protein ACI37R_04785 [Candidatus Avigastranaerophilus sp.]
MRISETGRYNLTKQLQQKDAVNKNHAGNENFKGSMGDVFFNVLDKGFNVLDKNAMIQVSVVDMVATDIPRTLVDLKTGLAAALETFRREFSGLFVNCLMPGLIVKGLASILPKANELKGTNVVNSWANSDSINKLKSVYQQAQESGAADTTKEYVTRALTSLEGLDGRTWVKYADKAEAPAFKEAVADITKAITSDGGDKKSLLKSAQKKLAELTKAESILNFNGKAQANLEETLRDVVDLGSKFNTVKDKTLSSMGKTAADAATDEVKGKVNEAIKNYGNKLSSFVNKKSFLGLAIVIGIAVSVQKINRAITRKQFKAEGAPIYKDFGKKDTTQKMDEEQKKRFTMKKIAAAAGMYGLAALSMMKMPSKTMFQFSGIFPTLDQCRWIASSTFASRMLAAEDENELRETTIRDIASFSGLYFLGDYFKKGAASAIEALSKTKAGAKIVGKNVVLLNRSKDVAKPAVKNGLSMIGYRFKQFGNWIKNTDLKTAAEVSSTKVRNLRNLCRVADIAFSIVTLGILLPKYNRKVTERKVEQAKKQEQLKNQAAMLSSLKNIPDVFKELAK